MHSSRIRKLLFVAKNSSERLYKSLRSANSLHYKEAFKKLLHITKKRGFYTILHNATIKRNWHITPHESIKKILHINYEKKNQQTKKIWWNFTQCNYKIEIGTYQKWPCVHNIFTVINLLAPVTSVHLIDMMIIRAEVCSTITTSIYLSLNSLIWSLRVKEVNKRYLKLTSDQICNYILRCKNKSYASGTCVDSKSRLLYFSSYKSKATIFPKQSKMFYVGNSSGAFNLFISTLVFNHYTSKVILFPLLRI